MASISPLIGIGIATAGIPDAINKGLDLKRTREASRAQALQRKQEGDLKLQQLQHTVDQQPLQDQQLQDQVQIQHMQLDKLQKTIFQKDTFSAMDRFFESSDPRSLNQFFKSHVDDPLVQSMFNGIVHVDQINTVSPEDQKLLLTAGLTQEDLDTADGKRDGRIDWTKLHNRFIKVTNNKGETKLTDMVHLAAVTGYGDYASNKQLDKLKKLADISKAQNSGLTTAQKDASVLAKENGTTLGAELKGIYKGKATHDPNNTLTAFSKEARAVAGATDRLANGTSTNKTLDERLVAQGQESLGGVGGGKQVIAEQARKTLKTLDFDSMSAKEMQSNPEVRDAINRIEELHPISAAQQKQLIDLSAVVALADPASKLDAKQTGLLDSITSGVKQYISDDTNTLDHKRDYEALIGTFRHALLGAAMSDSELALFTKAYGADKQKLGPVLSGLQAALTQVQANLETIGSLNDPSVIRFRTHGMLSDISGSLMHVKQRLSFLNKLALSSTITPKEAARQVEQEFASKKPITDGVAKVNKALGF